MSRLSEHQDLPLKFTVRLERGSGVIRTALLGSRTQAERNARMGSG
jgi:hypothetical protein